MHYITKENARELQKLSAEKKIQRKQLKEELLLCLSNGDVQQRMSLAIIDKACQGDVKAYEVIRDTIGEKPIDKQEIRKIDTDWFIDVEEDKENNEEN